QDIWSPDRYREMIMATSRERGLFESLIELGLCDVYRKKYPDKFEFTWFDYMTNAFEGNRGWRIDYIFATPPAFECIEDIAIDKLPRGYEKPSDHCPMVALLAD
ncbi:exodeoxyribonuclease III, partial [Candidatus Falkowbacteria bacterium]|nr:exodeoxyribonuclease III [Candidatus Falkowbacteria bacterium]